MKQNRLLKNAGLLIFSFLLFACTSSKTENTSISGNTTTSEENRIKEIIFEPDFEIRLDSASNIIRHQTDSIIQQIVEEFEIDDAMLDQLTVPKVGDIIENNEEGNVLNGLIAMFMHQLKGLRDIDIANSVRQDMKLFTFFTKYEQWQNIEENIKSYPISELKNTRQLDVTENKDSITVVVKSVYGQIELTNTFKLSNQADIDYIKVDKDVEIDIDTVDEEDGEKEFTEDDFTTEYEIEKGVDDVDCRIIIKNKQKKQGS